MRWVYILGCLREPFLKTGHTRAVFQTKGISPVLIDISKRSDKGKAIAGAKDFKKKAGKPSGVLEHFEGNDFKVLRTLSNEKRTQFKELFSDRRGTNSGSKPSSAEAK